MGHIFGVHEGIEFFARQEAQLDRRVTQAEVLVVRRVRHLGRIVVADLRR